MPSQTMKIISLAPTVWTERWMNRQQLMSRVGRVHDVLYTNGSWYTWERRDPRWKAAGWRGHFDARDNVRVDMPPRWMMRWPRLAAWDRAVVQLHAQRWRRELGDLNGTPLVLHLFHPAYADYVDAVRPDAVVYQPYDWFEFMPGWTPALDALERRLLQRADAVVTPSPSFAEGLQPKSRTPIRVVPNGVDLALFADAQREAPPVPADLAAIPHPRIGYVGWLEPHVDLGLVADLARRRPGWNFVFVGGRTPQADERLLSELAVCEALPNVHFLGPKQRAEVPAYMMNMDINTICWRVGDGGWADVGYPLKLQEYLACGRGIVSIDLHSVRTLFASVIRTASGIDGWEQALDEVLRTGGPGSVDARRAIAAENGWDRRCAQLLEVFDSVVRR